MKRKYNYQKYLLTLFLLAFICIVTFAQKGIKEGVIRVKFSPSEAAKLQSTQFLTRSSDGIVRTGMTSVDRLNSKYKVSKMTRVFPYAGKYENKHKKYGLHLWYQIEIGPKENVRSATQLYAALKEITYSEPVYEKVLVDGYKSKKSKIPMSLSSGTNDPRFNEQWGYHNTGQTGGTPDADVDLVEAWVIETGSPQVIVSVHDGGIDINHEDLEGNVWINTGEIPGNNIDDDGNGYIDDVNGYSFVNNTGTITPDEHGTHTSGTIACETNNAIGMSGVAGGTGNDDGVRVMSCEIFATSSGGFAESFVYAADNGAIISSNSWGYNLPNVFEQAEQEAIDYFIAEAGYDEDGNQVGPMAGGIVIFAAGNNGSSQEYFPGAYDAVMAVAGTDHNDEKYLSSNHGPWVELSAPAVAIWSTVPNDNYDYFNGTSMACPHVSGVAALLVSHFMSEGITPEQVWSRLVNTTDPLTFDGAEDWGSGRLNAYNALLEDDETGPEAISDLRIFETGQVSVVLSWTAPKDLPDNYPVSGYDIRYSTSSINASNFDLAAQFEATISSLPGETELVEISGLSPETAYYFAVKSLDFFNNNSDISNVVSSTTLQAPELAITGNPGVNIDVAVDTIGIGEFGIINNGKVDLNYDIIPVYRGRSLTKTQLVYPGKMVPIVNSVNQRKGEAILSSSLTRLSAGPELFFDTDDTRKIFYDDGNDEADGAVAATTSTGAPTNWAAATLFEVPEMDGETFKLTHVSFFFEASGAAGSVPSQLSIVKGGNTPDFGEVVLIQEFDNVIGSQVVHIPLEMPVLLQEGETFWVVYSFEAVPVKLGYDDVTDGNRPGANIAFFNGIWNDLQTAATGWENYVWVTHAIQSEINGVTIELSSGTIAPSANQDIEVVYNASELKRNGTYNIDFFVLCDDPVTPFEKLESEIVVTGLPIPSIDVMPDTIISAIDVNVNPVKTETLTIYNNGNGELLYDFVNPIEEKLFSIPPADPNFEKGEGGLSWQAAPRVSSEKAKNNEAIKLAGSIAYGHEVFPDDALISLSTDNPTTYKTSIVVSDYLTFAGDFGIDDNSIMYIVDKNTSQLLAVNVESGTTTTIGSTLLFTDLACDKTTGTMYGALFADPVSKLYTIDLNTGAATEVGSMGDGLIISMACDGNGNLWGFEIDSDNIYQINSETGSKTLVGSAGFDGRYAQSMAWDPITDVVYLAAFNNVTLSGELRVLDRVTGATELIGSFPGNAEITAFGFPGGAAENYISINPQSGTVAPNSSVTIDVTMDATNITNGEHISGINVYSNDIDAPMVSVPVFLTVSGQVGEIAVSTQFIEFETVFLNGSKEMPFYIKNNGIGDLTISEISSNLLYFSTDLTNPVSVKMGDSLLVKAIFSATAMGQYNGILTIKSDDPVYPTKQITVTAVSVSPPVMAINPENLEVSLDAGESSTESFTIRNYGMYPLEFSMPTVTAMALMADENMQKNNTSFIEGLKEQTSKDQVDVREGHPVLLGAGGPDGFGYLWIDSREEGGPIYSWTDISETGTEILPSSNDGSTSLQLPFEFEFYDDYYSSVKVSSNGYLTFGNSGTDYTNDQIPDSKTPNNIIAPYWDDLRPSSKSGQIFYQSYTDKFVVQYHEVGNYPISSIGTTTFQVILHLNGQIEYLYNSYSLENQSSATIGIENEDGSDGLQVAFNTEFVEEELAVLIFPGRKPFELSVSPVYGIVQPQQAQVVDLKIDATELVEGEYINELLITSNDPLNNSFTYVTELDVIGHPEITVGSDTLWFDPIFLGRKINQMLKIENTGSSNLTISDIISSTPEFVVDSVTPKSLMPGDVLNVLVTFNPTSVGDYSETLTIESNDEFGNEKYEVVLMASSLEPPQMVVSTIPSPIDLTLDAGKSDTVQISIANPGGSPLEYLIFEPSFAKKSDVEVASTILNQPEISKEQPDTRVGMPVLFSSGGPDSFGYTWVDSDDNAGPIYNWIEISQLGTKLDLGGDEGIFIDLPFAFPFYENVYTKVQVASNGFLTFNNMLGNYGGFFNQEIPDPILPNNVIAPFWDDLEPQDGDGVYVYSEADYLIVQYNKVSKFLSSSIATFQVILYSNGDIKYQYKNVEAYSGKESVTVGVENEYGTDGLLAVFNSSYVKDGLAVLFDAPFKFDIIPAGQTAVIDMIMDATSLVDGVYEDTIYINSNAVANSSEKIPVTLNVIGIPEISLSSDTIIFDDLFYVEGKLQIATEELIITNTGSKKLVIDSLGFATESGVFSFVADTALQLPPEYWTTVTFTFTPDTIGDFSTDFIIESTDPNHGEISVYLSGRSIEPPIISLNPSDTLRLELNSDEVVKLESMVMNLGSSILDYSTKIKYENINKGFNAVEPIFLHEKVQNSVSRGFGSVTLSDNYIEQLFDVEFTDSIIYDPEEEPDDFYGYVNEITYSAANKFIVESETFNLTHVTLLYRNTGVTTPVTMEIYAGGNLPGEGTLIATQQFYHPEASTGANCLIELATPIAFVENDEFFVVMHYPGEIRFPAAFNSSVPNIGNVSYWYNVNVDAWVDEDAGTVYKIRAYQASEFVQEEWLSINPETGHIKPADTLSHQVVADANLTTSGYHFGKIIYESNDPVNPQAEFPIEIHVNYPPEVLESPEDTVVMSENEIVELRVAAFDPDGGKLLYKFIESAAFISITEGDTAVITHAPGYDDEGKYDILLSITDDKGESVTVSWHLIVNNVNRRPEVLTDIPDCMYFPTDPVDEIDLMNYFKDPDGDELKFSVMSNNDEAYALEVSDNKLYITPFEIGKGVVTVMGTDPFGLHSAISFNIRVRHTENHAPELTQNMENVVLMPDGPGDTIDLSQYFTDKDWDELSYRFSLSGTASVNVSLAGSILTLSPWQPGMAVITIYADDHRGGVTATTFGVIVIGQGNNMPFLSTLLNNRTYLPTTEEDKINLSEFFKDPDGDQLTYIAQVESGDAVEIEVDNNFLLLTPQKVGESSIVIYASDEKSGLASARFTATVESAVGVDGLEITSVSLKNYPNPAKAITTFEYKIVKSSHVKLELLTTSGSTVDMLVDQKQADGHYHLEYSLDGLAPGIYLYRLILDGKQIAINKLTIE
jgi:subtilisin family serine protease